MYKVFGHTVMENALSLDDKTMAIHKTKRAIIEDEHMVEVPLNLYKYFTFYKDLVGSKSCIHSVEPISFEKRNGKSVLFYSRGSESEMLRLTLSDVDLIEVVLDIKTKPYYKYKREFDLALYALRLGYSTCYMGIEDFTYAYEYEANPWIFEYSKDFIDLWNEWSPCKVQYPLMGFKKSDIYRRLGKEHTFDFCDKAPKGKSCGNCWKCFEYHIIRQALGWSSPFSLKSFKGLYKEIVNSSDDGRSFKQLFDQLKDDYSYDVHKEFGSII